MRRTRFSNERGATILELALVAPLFLLLSLGILEMGRAVWAYNTLSHAAREGSRFAIVRGAESGRAATAADVQNHVRTRVAELAPAVNVTTTWAPDNKPGSEVRVRVEYAFTPVVPLFPSMALHSTSRMVISF